MREPLSRLWNRSAGPARPRPAHPARRPQAPGLEFDELERRDVPSATFQSVATGFTTSVEFRAHFVADAYERYLHRPASQAEINGWVQSFHNEDHNDKEAQDELTVLSGIVSSREDFNSHGGTAQSWVAGLYNDV